ncbi:hypothetical protein THAOC_13968 [Thalassiosira oceanica]|uniref:Uncharacterized protein n=1 Tax=Thalassiosira oceanica TaxID=159749 RepID=K0T4F4_THAOC|nr:hypothetical protein THAOC_13968 [Thalassiosira oceanica]|eukprot:EJK65202.1 hypothetical protein THAOC_13968 [Thalassiosira oceanica]
MQLCNDQVAFGGSFGRFKIDVDRTTTFATSDLAGNHSFIEYIAVGIGAFVLRRFHLLPAAHNRDRLMTMAKFFHILSILATTAVKGQEQLLSDNETDIPTDDADAADEQSTPICADDELRLQLISGPGENDSWGAPASYRIFTDSPSASPASETEIHAECVGCRSDRGVVEELVMTWGGEIIHQSNAYQFASVDFGDGCQDYTRCDDGEAEFEFFLDRFLQGAEDPPAFSWELNQLSADGTEMDSTTLHVGRALKQSLPFIYERLCVPRSCLQFSMGYPSNTTEQFYDPSFYSIRRDGAIIAENELWMEAGYSKGDKLNQTVNLGESCTAYTTCDPRAESLVELEITVNAEHKCPYSENFNLSSASTRQPIAV